MNSNKSDKAEHIARFSLAYPSAFLMNDDAEIQAQFNTTRDHRSLCFVSFYP